jgi:hypothetical protein
MNREIKKRLELLEASRKPSPAPQGLGHFYSLTSEERGQRVAHLYPTNRPDQGHH